MAPDLQQQPFPNGSAKIIMTPVSTPNMSFEKASFVQNGHAHTLVLSQAPLNTTASPSLSPSTHLSRTPYWKTFLGAAPLTGLSLYFCWGRLIASGTIQHLLAECRHHSIHKTIIKYTFPIDKILCLNTSFFQAALDPANPPYAPGYLASFATCAFIPLIEATRAGVQGVVMKYPLLFGISSQLLGRSAIYPAWWANFVSSGSARKTPEESEGSAIGQYDAEATLFALLLGIITPTTSLSISPSWVTIWFVYPVTGALLRVAYKYVRERISGPETDKKKSQEVGFYLTMGVYLLGFVYAAALHIGVMTPCMWHPSELAKLLKPSLTIIGQDKLSVAKNVYNAVQWDAIIVFTSSLFATLSFARTMKEAAVIAVLDFLGVLFFGSGAALSGVWAWREIRMKKDREATDMPTKAN